MNDERRVNEMKIRIGEIKLRDSRAKIPWSKFEMFLVDVLKSSLDWRFKEAAIREALDATTKRGFFHEATYLREMSVD